MPKSRLFWKLVLTCTGVNLGVAVIVGLILSSQLHDAVADPFATRRLVWWLVATESLSVFFLCCWLIGRIIRPIESIRVAAEAIAAGDYRHRVYVPNRDELGSLAGTLNRMSHALGVRMTQLSHTAARQSTALGGMIEGVIAIDDRLRVVLANAAAGRLYGFQPAAVEGRPLLEVIRNHALHAAVTSSLATGEPQRIVTNRAGAQTLHVNIHVQPLPGEPCPGVVLVIHDTTELRRLESIRRDFVANVSHELKTPLSSIKAYTETLRDNDEIDNATKQRFLGRIEEQTDRLHHLIIDMLMLARIESDQQTFEITSVDVAEIVRGCADANCPAAEVKRIAICIDAPTTPCGPPCRVRADREGLREILDNLVDNAIKYTPEGGRITITWRSVAAGPRENDSSLNLSPSPGIPHPASCILTVTDTGIGIKSADQARIFERFYRVDKARSRELGGTGLGLAIVKHLTQAFGGRVAVQSSPGQGSTFTIELPTA
jgi:two-component system phosphate regulon sensor histidine kinase PhoR